MPLFTPSFPSWLIRLAELFREKERAAFEDGPAGHVDGGSMPLIVLPLS